MFRVFFAVLGMQERSAHAASIAGATLALLARDRHTFVVSAREQASSTLSALNLYAGMQVYRRPPKWRFVCTVLTLLQLSAVTNRQPQLIAKVGKLRLRLDPEARGGALEPFTDRIDLVIEPHLLDQGTQGANLQAKRRSRRL